MGIPRLANNDPARLARILNEKTRIDVQSLDQQLAFKGSRAAAQAEEERKYALSAQHAAEAAAAAAAAADAAWREAERRAAEYRALHQAADSRREWDLNRPDALRISSPARVGDNDARAGPASLQRFSGEDLGLPARLAADAAANRQEWSAEMAAHTAAKQVEKSDAAADAAWLRQQDAAREQASSADREAHRAAERRAAAANTAAAAATKAAKSAERYAAAAADAAELAVAANSSAVLTEDPSAVVSALGHHRVRPDHWKGMSAKQRAVYPLWQLQQIDAKAAAAKAEAAADLQFAEQQAAIRQAVDKQVHEVEAWKAHRDLQTGRIQEAQAAEKAARDAQLHELYDNNPPRPEYFGQFQTSHR